MLILYNNIINAPMRQSIGLATISNCCPCKLTDAKSSVVSRILHLHLAQAILNCSYAFAELMSWFWYDVLPNPCILHIADTVNRPQKFPMKVEGCEEHALLSRSRLKTASFLYFKRASLVSDRVDRSRDR